MKKPELSTTAAKARSSKALAQIGILFYALAVLLCPFLMWIGRTMVGVVLAVVLVILGVGIHKFHSRAAAITASLIFLALGLQGLLRGHGVGAVPLALFYFSTRAVQASFDYHRINT